MVILASGSPRRRELLSELIQNFSVIPAKKEEVVNPALTPAQTACALASQKCDEVFFAHPQETVIGADTIVVFGNRILGKPKDEADAFKTLSMLSGQTHAVITGVCIRQGNTKLVEYEQSQVEFNTLTPSFIRAYIQGGSPMDKAGSYGIQDGGIVKAYHGSYTNIVGLPVELVKRMLLKLGTI